MSAVEELAEVPDWETFYKMYMRRNTPVVLRGAARSLRAFERWSDEYLLANLGGLRADVELNKTESRGGRTKEMTIAQFAEVVYREGTEGDVYAIAGLETSTVAKADLHLPDPVRCQEIWPQSATLWMSAGGTSSVLHHDDAENLLMMLDGRKKFMLVHQDEAQNLYAAIAEHQGTSPVHQSAVDLEVFPLFANVSWLSGEINAGDVLYIPHSYWHQVDSYDRNLAINIWWQHQGDWRWWDVDDQDENDPGMLGAEGSVRFDERKARLPLEAKCTRLSEGVDLNKAKFKDEDAFKKYVRKKRRVAQKSGEL